MSDPESTYGLADEDRALLLLRALNECANDVSVIDFGLQVLSDAENEWQIQFLRSITAKISERIAPLLDSLSVEYLMLRSQGQPIHFH